MATYSYYIIHASLQYQSVGHGFVLTQMSHDLVVPGLPEISSKKPESFISNINITQIVEPDSFPPIYAPYTINMELTLVTEDDKTILGKIRDKMSVINRVSLDKTKIGHSLEFDSGLSINILEKFDFDEIIGKIHKKIKAALRKVAI